MPEKDYNLLLELVVTNKYAADLITSHDPKKIDELLTFPIFNFTHEEMEFLAGVKADSLKNFVDQTRGYWKD